jgi:hypothetical protein
MCHDNNKLDFNGIGIHYSSPFLGTGTWN